MRTKMRKHPSTIESTYRSTVYRTAHEPAVFSMSSYPAFDKNVNWPTTSNINAKSCKRGNHDI